MPYIVYKGERKVAELLTRAYGPDIKPAEAKRAEAALLAANPQLETLRDLKPGAVLVVPSLAGPGNAPPSPVPPARAANERETPLGDELTMARVGLNAYRERLEARLEAEKTVLAGTAELLKSKEVRELARAFPDSAPFIERATAGAKARAEEADMRAAFAKMLPQVSADLDEMAK